jgi:hypothetical protein
MNLMITIFGGMLATFLLYALGRGLRLSNFWSAVVASGLPSFVYLLYAVATSPSLDTITMHVIAYPTVGVMLYLLYGERAVRSAEGAHWAPRLMVVFFVLITLLFGGFVYVAKHGLPPGMAALVLPNASEKRVHTGFAGVVAHGEESAKSIAYHRNMAEKLARLGWQVEVVGLDALRPGHANPVSVQVRDTQGRLVEGIRASLALGRPGQPPQDVVALEAAGDAGYRGMAGLAGDGAWLAVLSLEGQGERVELQHILGGE